MKKVVVILATMVTLLALGTGAAYAAQGSLPGEALYPVKLGTEQVMTLLPGDELVKAEQALSFTERRMREIEALVAEGRAQNLDLAVERYGDVLDLALARIERARKGGLATQNMTARVAEATAGHLSVLDTVYDMVPDAARVAVAHAREMTEKGRQNALAALARDNAVQTAGMNLAAMEGRLNRIRATVQAGCGTGEAAQIALQQFEDMARFGQEISQIVEETGLNITEVAEIVTSATSIHLQVLSELYEEVPEEAKEAVERAMQESFRGYEIVIQVLVGSGVGEAQLPVIPEGIRQRIGDILGWTNAPKIRMPTGGGSSGQGCPRCRH
jgi:hypothetical protein